MAPRAMWMVGRLKGPELDSAVSFPQWPAISLDLRKQAKGLALSPHFPAEQLAYRGRRILRQVCLKTMERTVDGLWLVPGWLPRHRDNLARASSTDALDARVRSAPGELGSVAGDRGRELAAGHFARQVDFRIAGVGHLPIVRRVPVEAVE